MIPNPDPNSKKKVLQSIAKCQKVPQNVTIFHKYHMKAQDVAQIVNLPRFECDIDRGDIKECDNV